VYRQLSFYHLIREATPAIETEVASAAVSATAFTIVPYIDQVADEFEARLTKNQRAKIGRRLGKARNLANAEAVTFTETDDLFRVKSQTARDCNYHVDLRGAWRDWSCTCPDHADEGNICKHILAAYYTKRAFEIAQDQVAPIADTAEDAQDPPANPAQATPTEYTCRAQFSCAVLPSPEMIIYATVMLGDEAVMVEVLDIDQGVAQVRALPVHNLGMLQPYFCFPSPFEGSQVKYSTASVPKEALINVRVFRSKPTGG
jgi:hypothetical protein